MNEAKPFEHGEEGTHYACRDMINEGCCACNNHDCATQPHLPEDMVAEMPEWEKRFDNDEELRIYDFCDEKAVTDRIKDFIRSEIAKAKEEAVKEFVERIKERWANVFGMYEMLSVLEEEAKKLIS